MSLIALILTFGISVAWCAERLVRANNPAACLLAVPTLIGSWVGLMTLRLPPPAEFALAAFGLADLAVLVLSILGVLRLLGGFEVAWDDEDGGDDEDPPAPQHPTPRTPHGRRPSRPMPHRRPAAPRTPRPGRRVNA